MQELSIPEESGAEILRCIVVDDEAPARALLREYLSAHEDMLLLAECANGFEAVKAVSEHSPDVVFLDVQMPKIDGFEVLELLESPPLVVFTTAFDEYAVRAFEVHAADYLLKPISRERFDDALDRLRAEKRGGRPGLGAPLLAEIRRSRTPLQRILVRDGSKVHVIPAESIDYIEAQDDYIAIHAGGKIHLKLERIAIIDQSLDPARFVRIHRSFILNLERLARIEFYAKGSRMAILRDGTRLPVSRSGNDKLKGIIG